MERQEADEVELFVAAAELFEPTDPDAVECLACGEVIDMLSLASSWDALFCSDCLDRAHTEARELDLGGES